MTDDTLLMQRPAGVRAGAAARPPALGTRFEAPTPHGLLQLLARTDMDSAVHAAQAAVLLEGCADLLGALDGWLGLDLPWRWPASAPPPAVPPGAGPHWPAAASQLQAPWALWRALPPPPPVLARGFLWAPLAARLSLAWVSLDDDELAALEPGGALLLPAAGPEGHMNCRLLADGEAASPTNGLPLRWRPGQDVRASGEAAPPEPSPTGTLTGSLMELRLAQTLTMPGPALAGWGGLALPPLGHRAVLLRGERPLAAGTLAPWGDGWALLIDGVTTPA